MVRALETAECGLRGEVLTPERIRTTQQVLDRVGTQSSGIVAIRIAASVGVPPLAQQIPDGMTDLALVTGVIDAADQCLGQNQPPMAARQHRRNWHASSQIWR
jgi:hypothetical protein